MRCDLCPLCPTASDDVCAISEGEYGLEHNDGMSGCRHPYNWCKKKADEYADYLGEMGHQMGLMMDAENKGFKEGRRKTLHEVFDFWIGSSAEEFGQWIADRVEELEV